jgi:hypothetical protein
MSDARRCARKEQPAVPEHRFRIGQKVRLTNLANLSPVTASVYEVVSTLPARDNSPQYRLHNVEKGQERVAMERDLEAI